MNDTTYHDNQDFNPTHDVLLDAQGALIMDHHHHHQGSARLASRVLETLSGFRAADDPGKRSIATTLVREVLDKGGQFRMIAQRTAHAHMNHPREALLVQDQAIQKVENLLRTCRTTPHSGDFPLKEDMSEGSDGFCLVDHDEAAPTTPVAPELAVEFQQQDVSDIGATTEQLNRLSVMEDDVVDGAKGELMQRLSAMDDCGGASDDNDDDVMVIVDHNLDHPRIGEQVASSFVSILDLIMETYSEDTRIGASANALLYSEAMQIAFQSLVWTCSRQLPNRAARQVQQVVDITRDKVTVGVPKDIDIVMADDGNDTVGTDDGVDVSLLDGPDYDTFPMMHCHRNHKYMDKLEIVDGLLYKKGEKGEKEYYGSVLQGLPHGLGFMIYTKKRKYVWGHWRKGRLHGLGGAIYENDHRCYGHFVKDQLHGKAMYLTDDSKYLGGYRKHQRHGYGLLTHATKGTFEGNFREDRFEGRGEYTSPKGIRTKGEFLNWDCIQKDPW